MKRVSVRSILSCTIAGAALLLSSIGVAQAQGDFPTSRQMHNRGGGFGQFDLRAGETQTIVDIDESTVYRICIVGNNAKIIVDGSKETTLGHGDCWDVEGKKIIGTNDASAGDAQGTYEMMNPRRRRHMQ